MIMHTTPRPPIIKHFPRNTVGRDIAVGDIHGSFSALKDALQRIAFNPHVDRLFSVGDLIDRGPESELVLDWLRYHWFHPVRGNHEEFLLRVNEPGYFRSWMGSGGAWYISLSNAESLEYDAYFRQLPLAQTIDTANGLVGMLHADPSVDDWGNLESFISDQQGKESILWSRRRITQSDTSHVAGIHAVVVGHTLVDAPVVLGNVHHIETGGWDEGRFTFLCLNTLEQIEYR